MKRRIIKGFLMPFVGFYGFSTLIVGIFSFITWENRFEDLFVLFQNGSFFRIIFLIGVIAAIYSGVTYVPNYPSHYDDEY